MTAVAGIKREDNEKLVISTHRVWFCDGCGKPFRWDGASRTYGSARSIDNGDYHLIWVACSDLCRREMPDGFPKGVEKPKRPTVRFI